MWSPVTVRWSSVSSNMGDTLRSKQISEEESVREAQGHITYLTWVTVIANSNFLDI